MDKQTLIIHVDAYSMTERAWTDSQNIREIYDMAYAMCQHKVIYLCYSSDVRVVIALEKYSHYRARFHSILHAACIAVQAAGFSCGKLRTVDRNLKEWL